VAEVIWGLATSHVPSIGAGFDLTTCSRLDVDHGLTVPLSAYCPDPGEAWPCPVVPLLVNVIQYPQPTAARCHALGRALGAAIRSFPPDAKVAVFGTGGMSHQLAGAEGIELIMWLVMRGALNGSVTRIHETYHVPASNTATGLALFQNS
jgi:protocatechuate 4,5-dioxygenase beta chain